MARTRDADDQPVVKPRSDAYTGMLLLSLLVLIAGCFLLYLDYSQYPSTKAPKPGPVPVVGSGPAEGGGPAQQPGGAPAPAPGAPKG
jgi:hypothetical protein